MRPVARAVVSTVTITGWQPLIHLASTHMLRMMIVTVLQRKLFVHLLYSKLSSFRSGPRSITKFLFRLSKERTWTDTVIKQTTTTTPPTRKLFKADKLEISPLYQLRISKGMTWIEIKCKQATQSPLPPKKKKLFKLRIPPL